MIVEQKIEQAKLTASEQIIANYIIENKYKLKSLSTRDIAKATFTSSSSVVRFSQKPNYSGFEELKEDYIKEIEYLDSHFHKIDPNIPFDENHSIMQIANIMSSLMNETSLDTLSLITHDNLQKVVSLMKKSETIYMFSIENNQLLAQSFKYKMLRIGKRVVIEEDYGNQMYSTFLATPKDCAIVISYGGESERTLNPTQWLKKMNIPIIAITSLGDNSIKTLATHVIEISTREKLHSKIADFTTEYSITLVLNILYSCIFSKNYQENLHLKVNRTKSFEKSRVASSTILKVGE